MVLVIDNYDSFTYNLVQYLGELGAEIQVRRNDEATLDALVAMRPERIVVSPGPGRPEQAGVTIDLIRRCGPKLPILGVCLGHQAIGQAFGATIMPAPVLVHGKQSMVEHDGRGIFAGIERPFAAARYHSLAIAPETCPSELEVTAHAGDDVLTPPSVLPPPLSKGTTRLRPRSAPRPTTASARTSAPASAPASARRRRRTSARSRCVR